MTFDVSDPKVLRGVLEGDSLQGFRRPAVSPPWGSLGALPGSAQDALRLWAGHFRATRVFSSAPPGHYPLGHGSHDFVPGLWGSSSDTRPTSFDLGHYLCSKGILNASLEALLGLSLAFLAGYYSSPLLITATGHQEGHLPPSGLPQPRTLGHLSGRSRRPSPGTLRRPYPLSKVELTLLLPQLRAPAKVARPRTTRGLRGHPDLN